MKSHNLIPRALITNTAAKQAVMAKLDKIKTIKAHYKHGGFYRTGVGLNADIGMGEHADGMRRYYDGVLVHEERC